ncbi:MAG: energy-coupling factor transporter transmembrane protein EcfT [Firmicutes bacterium]|nr:energy-coupling factor transporter transmembrane protein EcfT [Bacillota bacterium]
MGDNLVYERRDVFLQSLHTVVNLFFIAVLFVLVMISDHPLFLIGFFLTTLLNLAAAGALEKGERLLRVGVWAAIVIMIVNPLVINAGETILWHSPILPVQGRIEISVEAVCYGAAMGIRLMTLMIVFCLYNEILDPDLLLGYMARIAYKSGLMLSLATRSFPSVIRDLAAAREVQQLRGVDFNSGNLRERVRKYSQVFRVVLISTLEGSFHTAEAMQARAFGAGPRSRYRRELWRPRDTICLSTSFLALVMAICAKSGGYLDFIYYPRLGRLVENHATVAWLGIILLCLALPAVLSWAWRRSASLRSRI